MVWRAKKIINYTFYGENTPLMMRASSFFYPEHLIFTLVQKSQGGQGPPWDAQGVGRRTTAPPPVYATDPIDDCRKYWIQKVEF